MSIGFRKSLFGFNCDDVISYIEGSQKSRAESENALNQKIDTLNSNIADLQKNISAVSAERDEIAAKLQEFNEKYEEIDRLAQNIGKLYLVAQSNAQAIMSNTAESSSLAAAEIEKNMTAITETQDALGDIRREMQEINDAFSAKLEALMSSLNETREHISANTLESEQHSEQYAAVAKNLYE